MPLVLTVVASTTVAAKKEQKVGFISILLGTLENMLTFKETIRVGEGMFRAGEGTVRARQGF